jgi:cytoskeletal protein CcmA (bactofilin family)
MWKRRDREEEQPSRGTSVPVPEPVKEGIPMSTAPAVRSYEPETPRGVATIGKAVYVKGQIIAREDLITIGANGRVAATIKARHVIIQGQVTGNVEGSEKVEIRNGAKLLGDVRTVKFVCEEEGTINGSVASLRPEPKAPPASEAKERAASAGAAAQTAAPSEPKK